MKGRRKQQHESPHLNVAPSLGALQGGVSELLLLPLPPPLLLNSFWSSVGAMLLVRLLPALREAAWVRSQDTHTTNHTTGWRGSGGAAAASVTTSMPRCSGTTQSCEEKAAFGEPWEPASPSLFPPASVNGDKPVI